MSKIRGFSLFLMGAILPGTLYAVDFPTASIDNSAHASRNSTQLINSPGNYSSNPFFTPTSSYNQRYPQPVYATGADLTAADCQKTIQDIIERQCRQISNCKNVTFENIRPKILGELSLISGHNYNACMGYVDAGWQNYLNTQNELKPSSFPDVQTPFGVQFPTNFPESGGETSFPETYYDISFTERSANIIAAMKPYVNLTAYYDYPIIQKIESETRQILSTDEVANERIYGVMDQVIGGTGINKNMSESDQVALLKQLGNNPQLKYTIAALAAFDSSKSVRDNIQHQLNMGNAPLDNATKTKLQNLIQAGADDNNLLGTYAAPIYKSLIQSGVKNPLEILARNFNLKTEQREYIAGVVGAARACDGAGCGDFGASRRDHKHQGLDISANTGDYAFAPISGTIVNFNTPYSSGNGGLRMITIQGNGTLTKSMYVEPLPGLKIGDFVKQGDVVGTLQSLAIEAPSKHGGSKPTPNHLHQEIWVNGSVIDPTKKLFDQK